MNRSWQQLLSASSLLCWHFLCHFFFSFFLAYFFTLELFKLPRLWGASENMPYFHLYHLLLCIVTLSVHALDLRLQIKERVHFSMTATQNIWQEKEIWRRASYYSGLLKKLFWEMDWSLFFLNAESWFGTIVCVCVCEWFTLSLWCYTPLCCVCVSVHPWPFIWIAGALYFCASHVASIFYSLFLISLPLLSPRPLLHRRQTMVLSMLHHTPLRDWLGSCLDDMSRVWCCEETVSARWLQTIIWLFVSNLY